MTYPKLLTSMVWTQIHLKPATSRDFPWVFPLRLCPRVHLGKEQIIHSFIHCYTHFSEVCSPPGSFERKADPLGTVAVDHAFQEPNSCTTLFLGSPWGCSVDSQQWTKCLSSSGLPQMKLYSCLGTRPGRKTPSDNRNALDIDEQMPHLWFMSFTKKPMLVSPITSMHVFPPPLQNGMESKPESLKNFYWPCLSFTLAP